MASAKTNHASVAAAQASEAEDLFARAGTTARRHRVLGYGPGGSDEITDADMAGNLADAIAADLHNVQAFFAELDGKLDEAAPNGGTYRESLLRLAATHR